MEIGQIYLNTVVDSFRSMKNSAERAMNQLQFTELQWAPGKESNSIDRIVKHLSGNMVSRWTDFLTTDGEKPNRDRDGEFEGHYDSLEELIDNWNFGWDRLFLAMNQLKPDDLLKIVYIRSEPHNVMQAIERQVCHISHHVGQIVYLAKQIRDSEWDTLTVARGKSREYLNLMNEKFRNN